MASTLPFMEPIHVLGAGSIGLFLGSSIRSAFPSYPLAVLFRPHHHRSRSRLSSAAQREIIVCTRQFPGIAAVAVPSNKKSRPQLARVPFRFTKDDDDDDHSNSSKRRIRNLFVCTKAYQAVPAIQAIRHRLHPDEHVRVVLFCNGALDVREKLKPVLQQQDTQNVDLIMASTTHGVINESSSVDESITKTGQNGDSIDNDDDDDDMFHLLHVGVGKTYMGMGASTTTTSIAQLLDKSGLSAKAIPNDEMEILLWQKLAANCVCNPLTALWNVSNGKLSDNPSFASVRAQVVQEVSTVGQALHPQWQGGLSVDSLNRFVDQVILANVHNKSSMYRDIQRQQPTEVDNLNGYIVRKTVELGLGTASANEELLGKIRERTALYGP